MEIDFEKWGALFQEGELASIFETCRNNLPEICIRRSWSWGSFGKTVSVCVGDEIGALLNPQIGKMQGCITELLEKV